MFCLMIGCRLKICDKGKYMIKYIVLVIIGFILGGVLTGYLFIMKCGKIVASANCNKEKYKKYYDVFHTWMTKREEGKNPSEYLKINNYSRIAIYGKGRMAEHLNNDLMAVGYHVEYYIDAKSDKIEKGIKLYRLNEQLPVVDLVIITVLKEYDSICEKLKNVYCNKNVCFVSAEQFVTDFYQ